MAREIARDEKQPVLFDLQSLEVVDSNESKKSESLDPEPVFKIRSPRRIRRLSGEKSLLRQLDKNRD